MTDINKSLDRLELVVKRLDNAVQSCEQKQQSSGNDWQIDYEESMRKYTSLQSEVVKILPRLEATINRLKQVIEDSNG
ncbi:MAG: hypothetical protein K1X44_02955 [Alphaproteobacteria bacterium]|nr:hypothetical protein [Alphaproteobacteria bacterium]